MTKWLGIGAVVVAVIVVAVFATRNGEPPSERTTVEKVSLGVSPSVVSSLVFIADAKGFFSDEGVAVSLKTYPSGKKAADGLENGEVDLCTSADFVLVRKSFAGTDLRALAAISSARNMRVVARKDREIAVPGDLRGKRIGVTAGSVGDFFLASFLAFNGLGLDDIDAVNLAPQKMAAEVTGGAVDAVLTWQPFVNKSEEGLGANAVSFPAQQGQEYFFILLTRKARAEAGAAANGRVLAALLRAEDWTARHAEEARQIIAERLKVPENELAAMWRDETFAVTLPQALLVTMDAQARWALKKGLVGGGVVPDFTEYLDIVPLRNVKPSAVGVF